MSDPDFQPTRLRDRKREAIVQAALSQFRALGFQGASMDGIAAAAGVSKRTVYNHFASKEDLFAEILHRLWQRSAEAEARLYAAGEPLREQLLAQLRGKLALVQDPGFIDLARVVIAETLHNPERARHMVERLGEKEGALVGWIRAAQADGRLRKVDAVYLSHQMQGLLKAFALWPQITLGAPPLAKADARRLLDDCVDLFLGHYERR